MGCVCSVSVCLVGGSIDCGVVVEVVVDCVAGEAGAAPAPL